MYQPQTTEASGAASESADVGEHEFMGVAHDDVTDGSFTSYQDADLASCLARNRGEMSRQFVGDDALGRNAAPEGPVEGAPLRGLQAAQVAGNGLSGDELFSGVGVSNPRSPW